MATAQRIGLMTTQKDAVYTTLQQQGYIPEDFSWEWIDSPSLNDVEVEVLLTKVKDEQYFFVFDRYQEWGRTPQMAAIYSPGREEQREAQRTDDWQGTMMVFYEWLDNLKRETNAKDYWSSRIGEEFAHTWSGSTDNFSKAELKLLDKNLGQVESTLKELSSGSASDAQEIAASIAYLKKQARGQTKQEWFFLFMGVIASKVADWGITNEHLHQLLTILLHGIQALPK